MRYGSCSGGDEVFMYELLTTNGAYLYERVEDIGSNNYCSITEVDDYWMLAIGHITDSLMPPLDEIDAIIFIPIQLFIFKGNVELNIVNYIISVNQYF